jgi:two-component system sensor histidine kinase AlgZ
MTRSPGDETPAADPAADAAGAAADAAATRPSSLWPASTRPADLGESALDGKTGDPDPASRKRERGRGGPALDVCAPLLALRVVLAVQAALAVGVLFAATGPADWFALQAGAMYAGVAGSVLWLVAVCALKEPLARRAPPARAGVLLGLGAAAALLAWWPLHWAGLVDAAGGLRPLGTAAAGAGLAGAAWAWLALRAKAWQPVDAGVRLAELQSRIRPHFLFNALNTALALVRVDPARAETVLEDLAQLFRVALAESGASVALDEEIDLAQRYLAIEQVRYGPRLQVSWDIDERVGRARVPPLVLQPLVENAVRHGVEPAVEGGRIWVQAFARRGQAVVLVSNTVPRTPPVPGHGIALRNVRERLQLLHDVAGQCETWREDALFRVRVTVPL